MKIWKTLVMTTLALAFSSGICLARERVGIIMDAPETFYTNPKVQEMVDTQINALFPSGNYEVVPMDTGIKAMVNYRNSHGINARVTDPRGGYSTLLKKDDIAGIGRSMNCNLMVYSKLSNGATVMGHSMLSTTAKTTVACDFKVYNSSKGMFTYVRQYMDQGKSTAVYQGLPSSEHAYFYAYQKILKAVKLDLTKL